ncbi:hypothetical protein ABZ330_00150 [Streptomyces sp. NPDC006172]|uniref:hypothetical protein n=1 Tax=Streptomyces sp. NPDC006172 TaxID=3154470 RepID=UPI0033DB0350
MYDTHTPAEWAQMGSLAVSVYAACSAPYFLLVDASLGDFDPRPAVRRVAESGRVDWLLITVPNAKHDAQEFAADARAAVLLPLRDAALTLTALVALLTINPEHR